MIENILKLIKAFEVNSDLQHSVQGLHFIIVSSKKV